MAGPQRYASASRGSSSDAENGCGEAASAVEVSALDVVRPGRLKAIWPSPVGERSEERAGFVGERVVGTVPRAVKPPHLPLGVLRGERMQHGERRRGADTGTDQEHRRLCLAEGERAARCCDLELITHSDVRVQIAAGDPVRLALDADPVVVGAGRP